jgi:hypothetical protein
MSGPADHDGYQLVRLDDGRYEHTFRQSTLSELDLCMEKGRLQLHGQLQRVETDATAIGTAMHAAIEAALEERLYDGTTMNVNVGHEIAQLTFTDLMALPEFRWVQTDEAGARHIIRRIVGAWWEHVHPQCAPQEMEVGFKGLIIHEDNQRVIRLNGTIDYVDERIGLVDWKSANQEYKQWEKQRWAIQPTVYTWAAVQLGLVPDTLKVPFTFVVMNKKGRTPVDWINVDRHQGDWDWLARKTVSIATLLEAELPEWPRNDNHALCSPKWCPAWDSCKGAHYEDGWPKNNKPDWVQPAQG